MVCLAIGLLTLPACVQTPTAPASASSNMPAVTVQNGATRQTPPGTIFRDCPNCPEMVVVPRGKFEMGPDSGVDLPAQLVTVRHPFAMGRYEVTQAQWRAVMGNDPSYFKKCGPDCPVEEVSWNDVQKFIDKLNRQTGRHYRLPTEAEWEYACYGGKKTAYCGSNDLDKVGWYVSSSFAPPGPEPVGKLQANGYGLYDMTGNVFEWTANCYDASCTTRAIRGGAWSRVIIGWGHSDMRATYRRWLAPALHSSRLGFRLARDLP